MLTCILAAATLFYIDPHPLAQPETREERVQIAISSYDEALMALSEQFNCSFINEEQMPLVVMPKKGKQVSFKTWATQHRPKLMALLNKHGAVLLRGFPIKSADAFAAVVKAFTGRTPVDYKGGEGSRHKVIEGVYTSTEAPAEYHIPLHHELSCTDNAPDFICFYCETAPEVGTGQTLLASTEAVTAALLQKEGVWEFFDGKTIKYISRHPPEGSFFTSVNPTHKTWQEAFETDDRQEVEAICESKGFEFQWDEDWLTVTRRAPAVRGPDAYFDHPYWYNQAHLYHSNPRIRGGWFTHVLASILYILPSTRQYDVELEGGVIIPQEIIYQIYDGLDEATIRFDWHKDDVLIVDNRRALHGRASYEGSRRVLVSIVR